jgi:Zn-dependent protease with chaperone function
MTNEQFESMVARLETRARHNPAGYRFRVLMVALLGYVYIGAIVLALVALLGVLVVSLSKLRTLGAKLIIVVGAVLAVILKAMWIRIPPPEGVEIQPRDAPDLFRMLAGIRVALKAPRFHKVLITDEFNAAIVQTPRLGIFGWYEHTLMIGLPLMKLVTVDQLKVILTHEIGHVAGGHGRVSIWIYSQRLRWSRLIEALEERRSWGSILFNPFFRWYAPYFSAYSFPLARAHEYEADAASIQLTRPETAAEMLTGLMVAGRHLQERYWTEIYKQASDHPEPSAEPFSSMDASALAKLESSVVETWIADGLAQQTSSDDTHPSMSDRLKALGQSARFAPPSPATAAISLLAGSGVGISKMLDHAWKENIQPAWKERHQAVQQGRKELAELDTKAAGGKELSLQEAFHRAKLLESIAGKDDEAMEQLRRLHQRYPDETIVCFALGGRLLDRDDDSGRGLIERAMGLDEEAIFPGCKLLRDYCWRRGQKEQANAWHEKLVERATIEQAAEKERNVVLTRDKFEPHGLPDEVVDGMCRKLRGLPELRKAFLVRKVVKYYPKRPVYVFGFVVTAPFAMHSQGRANKVLRLIHELVQFPGETILINVEGDNRRFRKKLGKVAGGQIL